MQDWRGWSEYWVFRWFIPVVRAYKYIGKWVCTLNTTIVVFDVHTHLPIYLRVLGLLCNLLVRLNVPTSPQVLSTFSQTQCSILAQNVIDFFVFETSPLPLLWARAPLNYVYVNRDVTINIRICPTHLPFFFQRKKKPLMYLWTIENHWRYCATSFHNHLSCLRFAACFWSFWKLRRGNICP